MSETSETIDDVFVESDKEQLDIQQIIALTKSVKFDDRSADKWQAALDRNSLVAYIKAGGQMVAFGVVEQRGEQAIIFDMCVDPSKQGSGYGTAIVESLLQQSKDAGYQRIELSAWSNNPTVHDFYEKSGFKDAKSTIGISNYMEKVLK